MSSLTLNLCYFSQLPAHLEWVQLIAKTLQESYGFNVTLGYGYVKNNAINVFLFTEYIDIKELNQVSTMRIIFNQSAHPNGHDADWFAILRNSLVWDCSENHYYRLPDGAAFNCTYLTLKQLPVVNVQRPISWSGRDIKILNVATDTTPDTSLVLEYSHLQNTHPYHHDPQFAQTIQFFDLFIFRGIYDNALLLRQLHMVLREGKTVILESFYKNYLDPVWHNVLTFAEPDKLLDVIDATLKNMQNENYLVEYIHQLNFAYQNQSSSTAWLEPAIKLLQHNLSLISVLNSASLSLPHRKIVSIIIPVYNAEPYIQKTLESVVRQTYRPLDVLIVNDGSTDNSQAIIERFIEQNKTHDVSFQYFHVEKNQGVSNARNLALDHVEGDFIAFWDADDLCDAQRLTTQVKFLEHYPDIDIVGTWIDAINDQDYTTNQFCWYPLPFEQVHTYFLSAQYGAILFGTTMIKHRQTRFENIRFNPHYHIAEDLSYLIDYLIKGARLANLPLTLYYYRQHQQNTSLVSIARNTQAVKQVKTPLIHYFFPSLSDEQCELFMNLYSTVGDNPLLKSPQTLKAVIVLAAEMTQHLNPNCQLIENDISLITRHLVSAWLKGQIKQDLIDVDYCLYLCENPTLRTFLTPIVYWLIFTTSSAPSPS